MLCVDSCRSAPRRTSVDDDVDGAFFDAVDSLPSMWRQAQLSILNIIVAVAIAEPKPAAQARSYDVRACVVMCVSHVAKDIDAGTERDPQRCKEYIDDIMDYVFSAQVCLSQYVRLPSQTQHSLRPQLGYMRRQQDITEGMRTILVDWLVEVSCEYRLQPQTFKMAVNYVDR
jgi:hypothetical protein